MNAAALNATLTLGAITGVRSTLDPPHWPRDTTAPSKMWWLFWLPAR
jgi:hypothetical protein